jgi:acyl-CoA synthetase (AMP-forming)/AMP-acid ligase II
MRTVFEAFRTTVERYPDKPFLCLPARQGRSYHPAGAEFTYGEINTRAGELVSVYERAGYGHGHRVALLLENRPEFFYHFLALNSLGASVVPINPDYVHGEVAYQLEHSDAALVIAVSSRVSDVRRAGEATIQGVPVVDAELISEGLPPAAVPAPCDDAPRLSSECAMLYTSGTTGRPKGCILSNQYFITAGQWYLNVGGVATLVEEGERLLNPLPLYHMNSLAVSAMAMMLSGGCLISPDRFHPSTWWEDVVSTRATVVHYLGVIPPLLLNLPESPAERTHGVKFGVGAGVDPKHHASFEQRFGFPLVEVWGMTETGRILIDTVEPRKVGSRAFGKPTQGLEARVVDENDVDVPFDQPGELIVRFTGSEPRFGFFSGYHKNVEATEEAWRGGWFHTGDTVRQDKTQMLYFIDRKKNIIRRSGENIAAAEIEAVLQSCEDVAQAAVIAVADPLREEEVYACIVLREGVDAGVASAQSIFDWCTEHLAYFKAPGYILFLDSLPTTGTQKVQKTELFPAGTDPVQGVGCHDLRDQKSKARRIKSG